MGSTLALSELLRRCTWLDPENRVIPLQWHGKSVTCDAYFLDIARSQFFVWQKHDPQFAAGVWRGLDEFADLLAAKLTQMAMKQDK